MPRRWDLSSLLYPISPPSEKRRFFTFSAKKIDTQGVGVYLPERLSYFWGCTRWQATKWPGVISCSLGLDCLHWSQT